MANTSISWTPSVSGSRVKWTWSGWVKRNKIGVEQMLFGSYQSSSYNTELKFNSSDQIHFADTYNSNTNGRIITTAQFKDTNAWYYIVAIFDNAAGSGASDKIQVWVNGVNQAGSYGNAPTQATTLNADGTKIQIGAKVTSDYFDGVMSHIHFCDGYHYDASYFGETDSTTGEWKIKTDPSVSYGTNGFWILKDGNSVTNQAGTSNPSFTVETGTLTKTEDNPSNVFCTGNPLARFHANVDYANGNNTFNSGSGWFMGAGTLGASTGKWYYEYKITTLGTGNGYHKLGFMSDVGIASSPNAGHIAEAIVDGGYAFYCQNGNLEVRTNDAVVSGYDISTLGVSFSNGDIMCLAIDMDNKRAYFRKNGDAWIKSANPVNGTNGLDISSDYTAGKILIPAFASYYNGVGSLNFGNGYFGTSAVTSAGTNSSGNGIFEFDVPTGYTALSTKGLNL